MVLGWLGRRMAQKSAEVTGTEFTTPPIRDRRIPASFGNLEDYEVLRRQSLRALCGTLMDRNSDCKNALHGFCKAAHRKNGDDPTQLVALAVPQVSVHTGNALIGIYLYHAASDGATGGALDPLEYTVSLSRSSTTPALKLVVAPFRDGGYPALCGAVTRTELGEENYPGGLLDPGERWTVNCNPTPDYCKWEYFTNELPIEGRRGTAARFHCLQIMGEWWVAETDGINGMAQQVAALELAENPNHDGHG